MADWLIDVNGSMAAEPPLETMILTAQRQVVVGPAGLMGRTLDEPTASSIRRGGVHEVRWPDGEFVSTAVATKGIDDFPGFGWTAVARLPQGATRAMERRLLSTILISGVALSLLLALLGYVIVRRLVPVDREPLAAPDAVQVRRPHVPSKAERH
jgi:hypothetical protein